MKNSQRVWMVKEVYGGNSYPLSEFPVEYQIHVDDEEMHEITHESLVEIYNLIGQFITEKGGII